MSRKYHGNGPTVYPQAQPAGGVGEGAEAMVSFRHCLWGLWGEWGQLFNSYSITKILKTVFMAWATVGSGRASPPFGLCRSETAGSGPPAGQGFGISVGRYSRGHSQHVLGSACCGWQLSRTR